MTIKEIHERDLKHFLEKPEDYTIRFYNSVEPRSSRVIYALLLFNGDTRSWDISFRARKKMIKSFDTRKSFAEAKELLIEKAHNYIQKGYKITVLSTGYDIPPNF